jgi:hypothetical protein
MAIDYDLKPYRVDHRIGRTHWLLQLETDTHEDALNMANDAATKGGESRVIAQHVIERVKA